MRFKSRSFGVPVRRYGVLSLACLLLVAAQVAAGEPKQVPFKETLELVGNSPDLLEAYYTGHGTHIGKITATEFFNPFFNPADPDSVFATYVKVAANGDELYGEIIPDDPLNPFTTGSLTIDGGTGRFEGATGIARYFIDLSVAPIADVEGTISTVGSSK